MKHAKLKLALTLVVGACVLGCRFLFPENAARGLIVWGGYWIILLCFFLFLKALYAYFRSQDVRGCLRRYWPGLLAALAGVFVIQLHEPTAFKVQFDEYAISGVARNMHFLRENTVPMKAQTIKGSFELTGTSFSKRPAFFPFAVCCVHDLTGYRPENVFILNSVVTFLVLFLTYYYGVQYGGWRLGAICMGLWLGLPLFAQSSTSGGYDVFNVLMIMLFWLFGREYLRKGGLLALNVFVLTTVLLAQVRSESILFVIPMAIIVLVRWRRQRSLELGWTAVFSPIWLLLPMLLAKLYVDNPQWREVSVDKAFFSLAYIQGNVERAIYYLFNPDIFGTNSFLLSVVGVISIIIFIVKIYTYWRKRLLSDDDVMLFVVGIAILVNIGVIMANIWGQLNDPPASRFSLPLNALFILAFGWVIWRRRGQQTVPKWLPVIPVLAFAVAVPSAAEHMATRILLPGRQYTWLMEQLKASGRKDVLIIANPTGPILYGYPAVGMEEAEANKWKIAECLKQRLYPEILVLEMWAVDYKTGDEIPYSDVGDMDILKNMIVGERKTALSRSFLREKVAEIRMRPTILVRLSRVTGVEGPESIPPEGYLKEVPPFKNQAELRKHIISALP